MNDTEPAALIDDHYTAEAQTLTTGAEANPLKLAELRDTLTAEHGLLADGVAAVEYRSS
ncbi:hypothetical protein [Streptomyces sp. NPDC007991]|uniref:hypothetical protein n=1 Tax=Streptomyces sp. NPDC007991 TaxID=3364803 RepID=UPI0036E74014